MNEISPCMDCPDRHPGCHGSCEKYMAWHERYQAQQTYLADNKYRFCIPESAAREKRNTHYTKHPVSGHKGGIQ